MNEQKNYCLSIGKISIKSYPEVANTFYAIYTKETMNKIHEYTKH